MREIITVEKVFDYEELSAMAQAVAKENVKEDLLEMRYTEDFTESVMYEINTLFKNSELSIQYDLSYSQGDGFNTYGKVDLEDFFKALRDTKTLKIHLHINKNCIYWN